MVQPPAVPFFGNNQYQPAPAGGNPGIAPAAPFGGTAQLAPAPPILQTAPLITAGLVHWGFIHIYPHVDYNVSYGNSLQAAPGFHANTVINELSPGILIKLGDHWSLDYTPTLRFYSSPQLKDAVDQTVSLGGSTTYQDWTLAFSQAYSETSQPIIETASQLTQEIFNTSLNATHSLGSQFSLNLGVNQSFRYVDQGQQLGFQPVPDTREWSTMEWLNYKIAPRLSAGIGAGFTYDNLSVGPDMTSEQLQGRVSWTVIGKLTLSVSGGADYRQFVSSQVPNLLSPIFSVSAVYALFPTTTLSVSASQSVSPSYYQNSLSEVASVSAGLRQRLLKRLFLDVNAGYSSTTYNQTATVLAPAANNNYDVTSVTVRLSTVLLKRASASIFFQESFVSSPTSNAATAALFNYTTTQYGLALGYRF